MASLPINYQTTECECLCTSVCDIKQEKKSKRNIEIAAHNACKTFSQLPLIAVRIKIVWITTRLQIFIVLENRKPTDNIKCIDRYYLNTS